jgi:hypothetical protein
MKKIAGKIAMVLILVMLASSFTSCLSYWGRDHDPLKRVAYAVVDIVTLPVSLICLVVYIIITQETESQGYLANFDNNTLEYYSLYEKMYSLPEAELVSLMQTLRSIPEAERDFTMEKLNSLPETKLVSLVTAYSSLSESDIISSIERIISLPEEELVPLLRNFNSLTEAEFDSLIESINSKSEMGNVALVDNFNSLPEIDFLSPEIGAFEAKPVTIVNALQYR